MNIYTYLYFVEDKISKYIPFSEYNVSLSPIWAFLSVPWINVNWYYPSTSRTCVYGWSWGDFCWLRYGWRGRYCWVLRYLIILKSQSSHGIRHCFPYKPIECMRQKQIQSYLQYISSLIINNTNQTSTLPAPCSDDPQLLSTKTLKRNSPSSPLSNVQGMTQYRPCGNKIRLLTSLKLMNVSTRST